MKLKEIAENHGLTPEGVDYALTQYQIVICEITHGMMSKLSYDAHDVIRVAQERWCDTCELKEPVAPKRVSTIVDTITHFVCGHCEMPIGLTDRYCSQCGRKAKWDDCV